MPHLPNTAHPCPSRSAHEHSSAFLAMSLPLHRHVSASHHASSPHSHAPVRYAGARTILTCALSPYDALALLDHLCSCARPRPCTHTQALRLLHDSPCSSCLASPRPFPLSCSSVVSALAPHALCALRPCHSAARPRTHLCPCTCRLHSRAMSLRNVPPA
jgi:hypothetical protein